MKGRMRGPRRRKGKRRKLFSCSWHWLAWLVGFEMSLPPSLLFSIFVSLSLSPPLAITPLPLLPFLSSWIITFLAFRVMPAFALPLLKYPTPPIFTSLFLSPSFINPPLPFQLSFCDTVVDKQPPPLHVRRIFFLLSDIKSHVCQ